MILNQQYYIAQFSLLRLKGLKFGQSKRRRKKKQKMIIAVYIRIS